MRRTWFALGGTAALALAAVMLLAPPTQAQRWGRGWDRGWRGRDWGGFSVGWYPGYGLGFGYNNYGWGNYNGPWYGGYSYWPQYDYGYSSYWPQYNYGYSYPTYTYDNGSTSPSGLSGGYANMPQRYEGSYESSAGGMVDPDSVVIDMRVPPNAQVWFDNHLTQQQGANRKFVSPPVQPNKDFTYDIRVQWMENGQRMDRTRKLTVHAGDRKTIDFMNGDQGVAGNQSGTRGTEEESSALPPSNSRQNKNPDKVNPPSEKRPNANPPSIPEPAKSGTPPPASRPPQR